MNGTVHDLDRLERLATGELDGADRDEALRHVAGCEDCRSWLDTYRLLSEGLAPADAPAAHPASEQLARYCADRDGLTETERRQIAAHLAGCPACAREESLTASAVHEATTGAPVLVFARPRATHWQPVLQGLAAASLIMAAIFFLRPEAPKAGSQLLAGDHLSGTRLIDAADSITATSTTIESGGDVTFRAGDTVVLGEGFSIGTDAGFRVEIVKADVDATQRPATRRPAKTGHEIERKTTVRKS